MKKKAQKQAKVFEEMKTQGMKNETIETASRV